MKRACVPCVPGLDVAAHTGEPKRIGEEIAIRDHQGNRRGGQGHESGENAAEWNVLHTARAEGKSKLRATTKSISKNTSPRPRHIEIQRASSMAKSRCPSGRTDCPCNAATRKVLRKARPVRSPPKKKTWRTASLVQMRWPTSNYIARHVRILYENGEFYFIEYEHALHRHPVTEPILGSPCVRGTNRVLRNGSVFIPRRPEDHDTRSRSDSTLKNCLTFSPARARSRQYHAPGGLGGMDSAVYGYKIPPYYGTA